MEIRAGYDIAFQCLQEIPIVLMLSVEPARLPDLLSGYRMEISPDVSSHDYVDMFGNTCTRIVAQPGLIQKSATIFEIFDSGLPDDVALDARQVKVGELPDHVLIYVLKRVGIQY